MSGAGVLRHWLWRTVCGASGGLTVTGRWEVHGGAVIVANHSSHADTAVLLAALPPAAKVRFAAAVDYWFDIPARRLVATSLIGVLPLRRSGDGGYTALRDTAGPLLDAGHTVVIYPEGTRSTDGGIAEFRSGAVRLARDFGVPIVPVALLGIADVLPKGGRFSPGSPMEVRLGDPVDPHHTTAAQLRAEVVQLATGVRHALAA